MGTSYARRACTGASRSEDRRAQAKKFLDAQFKFEDFYSHCKQVKKMGPLADLPKMIPGLGGSESKLPEGPEATTDEKIEAIIFSMTRAERRPATHQPGPDVAGIGVGSGTTVSDVNQLVKPIRGDAPR